MINRTLTLGIAFLVSALAIGQERAKYDGKKAAEYAREWALKNNPKYETFDNDCTSFVSQALHHGGWAMIDSSFLDRMKDDVWWYGGTISKASYTWGGAQNLYNFLKTSGRGTEVKSEKELQVGDVIQIKDERDHIYHTMLVTNVSTEKGVLLSYHSSFHLDEPLNEIKSRLKKDFKLVFWKIQYSN